MFSLRPLRYFYKNICAKTWQGGVVKQKTMHRLPVGQIAFKTGILVTSFFLAHMAFGKPAAKQEQDSIPPAKSQKMAPISTFAQLSMQSRQFLEKLWSQVNANSSGAVISMPTFIEIVVEWSPRLAKDPNLTANLENAAGNMESWFGRSGIQIYKIKAQSMREIATVLRALQGSPEEQAMLQAELEKISKTYTGLVE
jgi:hypothetical protein